MPIELQRLVDEIRPEKTVLLFGAGATVPSGAPSVKKIIEHLSSRFRLQTEGYSFSEICSLVEGKTNRNELVSAVRQIFKGLHPSGGILNLPLHNWKNIYTTNYDEIIEECYSRHDKHLSLYSSNFDFTVHDVPETTKLFKLHGTISKDTVDGNREFLILTEGDNDKAEEYRERLFDNLKGDLSDSYLVIIGHSLADDDIRQVINRAHKINSQAEEPGRIYLLMYTEDLDRASLFENRGLRVCFSSIDSFFSELAKHSADKALVYADSDDPLDRAFPLQPVTVDVEHSLKAISADAGSMFNGWPATYSDIAAGLTFNRSIVAQIEALLLSDEALCAVLLGASGVGKTTAARQSILFLREQGFRCWEHQNDHTLLPDQWTKVAQELSSKDERGVILVDDCHNHLFELNKLVDNLASKQISNLKILSTSSKNHWNHRVKSPTIFNKGKEFEIRKLDINEINELIRLSETNADIRPLVEESFGGFSRQEKRRRLNDRCDADTFVCLKNIFASERFDDIILREYADLEAGYQNIYRLVAAMEASGVRVHRQLVMRVLSIPAASIPSVLEHLADIVHEYTVSEREGIYGWRGRHSVIVSIISKYKFSDKNELAELFDKIINSIVPTYEIEIRSIRELCNLDTGITSIPQKTIQNRLLRKMISAAPGERVPRHRLISNLIADEDFEKAETEIRLFENDIGIDGPVYRYKVQLLIARAESTKGIMKEDRMSILDSAREMAVRGVDKYHQNKNMLRTYCDVGLAILKLSGNFEVYDAAIRRLKSAEENLADPDISRIVLHYERLAERLVEGQQPKPASYAP